MTTYTMKQVYEYLGEHFVHIDVLSRQSGLSVEQLEQLIEHQCIPAASYEIVNSRSVRAHVNGAFSLKEALLDRYFAPSVMAWIERAKPYLSQMSLPEVALKLKSDFTCDLKLAISQACKAYAFTPEILRKNGDLDEAGFEEYAQSAWSHWAKGTYGVCVINADCAERIAMKQLIVEQLSLLTDEGDKAAFDTHESQEVFRMIQLYNQYAMPFSPHDVEGSSRQRLVNNILPRIEKELHHDGHPVFQSTS